MDTPWQSPDGFPIRPWAKLQTIPGQTGRWTKVSKGNQYKLSSLGGLIWQFDPDTGNYRLRIHAGFAGWGSLGLVAV